MNVIMRESSAYILTMRNIQYVYFFFDRNHPYYIANKNDYNSFK